MRLHLAPIASVAEIRTLCEELARHEMIAVDTEFMRERTFFPHIALIQVATDQDAWLIDALAFSRDDLAPLFAILQHENILKILHAAQGDQECIYSAYGITMRPSFDTMEAASLVGMGTSVGLGNLLHALLDVTLPKGRARTDWMRRPLPEELRQYALEDVAHLVKAAQTLFAKLDRHNRRALAMEHSARWEDVQRYQPQPKMLAEKIARAGKLDARGFAILLPLIEWREQRARELDVPRRRLAEDAVLVDLSRARPTTQQQLSTFRGLPPQTLSHDGAKILHIIATALALSESELPELPRSKAHRPTDGRKVEVIACAVRVLAGKHHIAPQHLLSTSAIEQLAAAKLTHRSELTEKNFISAHTDHLIGDELWQVLCGKLAIGLQNGKAALIPV